MKCAVSTPQLNSSRIQNKRRRPSIFCLIDFHCYFDIFDLGISSVLSLPFRLKRSHCCQVARKIKLEQSNRVYVNDASQFNRLPLCMKSTEQFVIMRVKELLSWSLHLFLNIKFALVPRLDTAAYGLSERLFSLFRCFSFR